MVWKTLEKDPLFNRPVIESSTDEKKRIAALQLRKYIDYRFVTSELEMPYRKRVSTTIFKGTRENLSSTGVPRGSVLRPLLLDLLINDLYDIKCICLLFYRLDY